MVCPMPPNHMLSLTCLIAAILPGKAVQPGTPVLTCTPILPGSAKLLCAHAWVAAVWSLHAPAAEQQRNSDLKLASTPPDQASLRTGIRLLDRSVTIGGEWIVATDRDNVPEDAIATDGYGKLDLFTSWTPERGLLPDFELRFNVDNLLDKNFRIHPNGINQPGRSFRLSLARTFAGILL